MNRDQALELVNKFYTGGASEREVAFAKFVASAEREHIKELELDAARYRIIREWNFDGHDYGFFSPEDVDKAVDNCLEDDFLARSKGD